MKVAICRIHVVMWLTMDKFKLVFGVDERTYCIRPCATEMVYTIDRDL